MAPSSARQHAEWLSLVEVSGPFLSLGTLVGAFPQGLDAHNPETARDLRRAHAEWEDEGASDPAIHHAWIRFVLGRLLELPPEVLHEGQELPATLSVAHPESGESLRPDIAVVEPDGSRARLLVVVAPSGADLDAPPLDSASAASPIERIEGLCAVTGVRLGLVTNGERWILVDSAPGAVTSRATWHATLWIEEQLTLRAFRSLLGVSRFFSVADDQTLEALLTRSAEDQQSVTDQLGLQVRQAVETLVHALDLADRDRSLLRGVSDQEVYEACLTVMMRLVVLLSAEERGLLLLGDDLWDESYAIGTLRARLRADADNMGEEVLERRRDAWPRLLAAFRAIYGGVTHGSLRLPAYGGALLDPDRYPFLEGRPRGTDWRATPASPLPVDNRTVLHLLDALQQLEVKVPGGRELRALSFRGLDVEQIGHVYEGLLDHTAFRTSEPAVALAGRKEPELALRLVDEQAARGRDELVAYLADETGLTPKGVEKRLDTELDEHAAQRLAVACEGDAELHQRVLPYAGLIRPDSFGYPLVFPEGSLFVTADPRRRNTGTHYTPPSLTEPIVRYALEPLVYEGPAEGWEREKWRLKPPGELLDLKVCDIAMGSGAFLVQACRYLAERLLEAWEATSDADAGPRVSPEGSPSAGAEGEELIPADPSERLVYARRLIASRCLYGVDKDPMAVEMAKLSLWLVTLQKDRPFTFLDHALRCGDSLLGITSVAQLTDLNPDPGEAVGTLSVFAQPVHDAVERATALRAEIEDSAPLDVAESEAKARLLAQAEAATDDLRLVADLIVGADLGAKDYDETMALSGADVGELLNDGSDIARTRIRLRALELLNFDRPAFEADRRPFHWALEFPEVFAAATRAPGFDAIVGNPPFLSGSKIAALVGASTRNLFVRRIARGQRGVADLVCYFLLRASDLVVQGGLFGLIATNSIAQGASRDVGLRQILGEDWTIYRAVASRAWPGVATTEISEVWATSGTWAGDSMHNGKRVKKIGPSLSPDGVSDAHVLSDQRVMGAEGVKTRGSGFIVESREAERLLMQQPAARQVVRPYLGGEDITTRSDQEHSRYVIYFREWPEARAAEFQSCFALVRERVFPERQRCNERALREAWWIFERPRTEALAALGEYPMIAARAVTSNTHALVIVGREVVPANTVVLFGVHGWGDYGVLQCAIHEAWVWVQSSSLRTDVRYTFGTCLKTFPFPAGDAPAETAEDLHEGRRNRALARGEGLTKLANRINDADQNDDDLVRLRELMVELDRQVAAAYGWDDLDLAHGFHDTRFGRRFTIGPDARQEILDRLLELNHERYADEVRRGLHEKKSSRRKARATR